VLALLTVAVTAAVAFGVAAYTLVPGSADADFGSSNAAFTFQDTDPKMISDTLSAATDWFGTVDAIGHRSIDVPGLAAPLDLRAQSPDGAFGAVLLDVTDGRFPTTEHEVAVTDQVASTLDVRVGDSLDLGGDAWVVVGIVENPKDLDDEFVLAAPGALPASESVEMLVDAPLDVVEGFRPPDSTTRMLAIRGSVPEGVLAAVSVLAIASVALLLVGLIAAASFIVLAQRRLRQLGMIGALGASERHLRLVMIANGALTGLVAAILGAALGVTGWILVAPQLEQSVGRRIDGLGVPWWLVLAAMVLAVLTATLAAWWPARAIARVPTVLALSGRPAQPQPVHRSTLLALTVTAVGVVCLVASGEVADDTSVHWKNVVLIVVGTLATVIGVLLASPLAVRLLARLATPLPVGIRLALRDLGRYQARSGAALAAISLAIGIPVAVVLAAASAVHAADSGNLSTHQLLVRAAVADGPFIPLAPDIDALQAGVQSVAESFDNAELLSLMVAVDPDAPDSGVPGVRLVPSIGEQVDDGLIDVSMIYVATTDLLALHAVDLDSVSSDVAILTTATGQLGILGDMAPGATRSPPTPLGTTQQLEPAYTSVPGTFITDAEMQRRGWVAAPSGRWLIDTSSSITGEQLASARELAAAAGLTIESRDHQTGLNGVRRGATAAGLLLALAILAMTVGLIRSEAAGDVRTLTANGASSGTRRALTAATAASLAALAALLGIVGAYLTMLASHVRHMAEVGALPWSQLAVIGLGTPAIAAAVGWVASGREPSALARQPLT
jgi:putative ABC transport system permease protein